MSGVTPVRAPRIAATFDPRPALPPEPKALDWTLVGVVFGMLGQLVLGVFAAGQLAHRVETLEQSVPPGAVARIDERTQGMDKALDRIEDRLSAVEGRR